MIKQAMLTSVAAIAMAFTAPALAQDASEDEGQTAAPTLSAPTIEYTSWQLENGLTVIALPDNSTANVTTSLWYKVGSKHDPEGRSGFSHLFEHILSRKTVNMPYNMINKLTEDVGGQRNASNWVDRTNYFETVPAQYLETMLWTHRERMAFPVVDAEVFENERNVVKEELRTRVLAPPYGRLQRLVIPENAFDVLPMRRPGIGSIEDLDSATLEDARAFHQAYYGPDTATLIVAGNFETDNLRALVDEYFGDIAPRANPISLKIEGEEPVRTEPRSIGATAPNVPLPLVGGVWKAPSVSDADAPALEILSAILSRGDSSRLHSALVRTGNAVDASHFASMTMDGGFIANFAVLSPTAQPEAAAAILNAELERIRTEPVSDAELREAKNEIFSSALSSRQTVRGRAFELGEALVSTGNPGAADERLARIAAVTAADVQRAAAKWLDPNAKVSMSYTGGEDDPSTYANPVPRPTYSTVPPATGEPRKVLPEGERMAPPPAGAIPAVVRTDFVETQLANGIPLVSAQTSDVPIATITVVFPGGSASDPTGKAGLASFAADLADQGTATRSAPDIAATLESLGASLGISSASDGTYASLTAPTVNLAEAGAVLVDVIQNANYPTEELERERKRALDGIDATLKDPSSLAGLVATRVMYGDAPYGQVVTKASIPKITREDLSAHRAAYWHPETAKIVISGGISSDEAAALAGNLFGGWSTDTAAPAPIANPAGNGTAPRTLVIDMPAAGQAAVIAGVRGVSRSDGDYYPLLLANTVLGAGSNGRLFEEVRTKRALAYGAYSSIGQSADAAVWRAQAQTDHATADDVATVFFEEFSKLNSEPATEDEIEKRRLFLAGAISRSLETSGGFNGQVANLLLRGIEPSEAFAITERLADVSAADAAAIAEKYLTNDRASLVVVGKASEFVNELRALRGEVEVIAFDDLDLSQTDLTAAAVEAEAAPE